VRFEGRFEKFGFEVIVWVKPTALAPWRDRHWGTPR
jgi:hypothetical protein